MGLLKNSRLKKLREGKMQYRELLSNKSKNDKEYALAAIHHDWRQIENFPTQIKNDKEVILAVVQQLKKGTDVYSFLLNCERDYGIKRESLKDSDIMQVLIELDVDTTLDFLDKFLLEPKFKKDINLQQTLSKKGILKYNELNNNDMFMEAVKHKFSALFYIPFELQTKDMVLTAISGKSKEHIDNALFVAKNWPINPILMNDIDIVTEIIKRDPFAIAHSPKLKKDKDYIINILNNKEIKINTNVFLSNVDPIVFEDENIALIAIKCFRSFDKVSERLQKDPIFISKVANDIYEHELIPMDFKAINPLLAVELDKISIQKEIADAQLTQDEIKKQIANENVEKSKMMEQETIENAKQQELEQQVAAKKAELDSLMQQLNTIQKENNNLQEQLNSKGEQTWNK